VAPGMRIRRVRAITYPPTLPSRPYRTALHGARGLVPERVLTKCGLLSWSADNTSRPAGAASDISRSVMVSM
jgi:hypothetical protein